MKKLELTPLADIPLIQAGDNLAKITLDALSRQNIDLFDGDILVFAQKIVSKAENRLVYLPEVQPSEQAIQIAAEVEKDPRFIELVLRESHQVLRKRAGTIIVEHRKGFICANAGIDHSNVRGPYGDPDLWVLLLPEEPDRSAQFIRNEIEQQTGVKIGVLIIDSHGRAWRLGTVGVAIGLAGMPGLVDLRGEADMFGYHLRITQVAVADELAAAASLVMGQADERTPIVHVRGFPYPLREGSFEELPRPAGMDLFR
ncbi:coenzyme F420-0:L-glutamate ligase [Bellilinea sp.]|uniref:coenzyme F420-0:L-glutamate ligase n=1 Tax=Bellilinea sp. TaxID=2838785 RepID=UPI002ADE84B9|nr:coenzyme F420-0:L-glutamate ligase [Bellilinea sp.]